MGYRKLTVDGTEYEYSIGRSVVKFRGNRKPVPHSEIGLKIAHSDRYMITPGTIAEYLRTGKVEQPTKCKCGKRCESFIFKGEVGTVNGLRVDPFSAEIHDKYHYGAWCEECVEEMGMAI